MRICNTTSGPAVCARFEHFGTAPGGHSQGQRVRWALVALVAGSLLWRQQSSWVASAHADSNPHEQPELPRRLENVELPST